MRKLFFLSLALLCAWPLCAQNARYSTEFPSLSPSYSPLLMANVPPNSPVLSVCNSPANNGPGLACTNYATTYTESGVACPNGAQDTPDPQPSSCQSTGDAFGNIGFWAPAGQYDYTVCIQNTSTCYGPYTVTLGGSGGGSGTVNTGTAGQAAYYAASGTAVSGQPNLTFSGNTSNFPNGSVTVGGSPPSACGTATGCIATATSTGSVTPTSGQNTQRFSSTQLLCSINGAAEAACGSGSSGGGGNPTLDNCTPDQSGNSFYSVVSLTNYFYAGWQFVFNTTTYFNCTIYVPTAQTGATLVLDIATSDNTAGHTASFTTCDEVVNSGTLNVASALTCASPQTFTTSSTAYNRVSLTFNVQSTLSNGSILLVKIGVAPSGTAPTANLLVYPHFVL
jgi:hypothetical protein